MDKIGKLIQANDIRKNCLEKQEKFQSEISEIHNKFGATYLEFAKRFNPQIQLKLIEKKADYPDCFHFPYPTLKKVGLAYTDAAVINWIKIQFDNLNDYVGVKEKMSGDQIQELSSLFYFDCYFLNIAETALFFVKIKTGQYGEFYGSVDPMKIMSAKNTFLNERVVSLQRHAAKLEQIEMANKRAEWEKKAVTYEEYLRIKKSNENESGE